jgi:hypothetical protein
MSAFEILTTVAPGGDIHIAGAPFPPGTEVEVVVSPRRQSPPDFLSTWAAVTAQLRSAVVGEYSDAEIDAEIKAYRLGR